MIRVLTALLIGFMNGASAAANVLPKPASGTAHRILHGPKPGPEIARQLTNFNDLEFHAHPLFYAKTLSFGESVSVYERDLGPFTLTFACETTGATFQLTVRNSNSYAMSYHGTYQGGSGAANLLNAGESATMLFADITPSGSGNAVESGATGAVLTSTGYYIAIDNSDSFLLSVSTDDGDTEMPNSDCSAAGMLTFAHPHHGGYYEGLLSEYLDLSEESSKKQATMLFGGVFFGMLCGAVVLGAATLLLVKNRSLFLHSIGYYESSIGSCIGDASWDRLSTTSHCLQDAAASEHGIEAPGAGSGRVAA
jgi:hypothetical protein